MKFASIGKAALIALSLCATAAHAGIISFTSAADLAANGRITQTTSFDSYPSGRGDSTSVFPGVLAGDFSMAGGSFAHISRPMFTNRTVLTGGNNTTATLDIAGKHDLFGFDAESYGAAAGVTFDIVTNLATYTLDVDLPSAFTGLEYFGFKADAGEYFTGFAFVGKPVAGITDLQLGTTAAADSGTVPEPASLALVLSGVGLAGLSRRRKQT